MRAGGSSKDAQVRVWKGLRLQQVLKCKSLLSSGSILLTLYDVLPCLSLPLLLSFPLLLLFSLLPLHPQGAALPLPPSFHPLGFLLALKLGSLFRFRRATWVFFSLSELCSTAERHEPSQVKAAHDHVKVQRLSWGRLRFGRCLHVLSMLLY